jgi:hypothetical protein
MRALESAMACNPHVGLFLTLPNVFEEVVDVATLLPDIVGHHHHRRSTKDGVKDGVDDDVVVASGANAVEIGAGEGEQSKTLQQRGGGGGGRSSSATSVEFDAIAEEDVTDVTVALAYSIDQFGCWRDAGNEEGNDVRTYVYETAIYQYYEPLDNKCHDISSVKLVRATYQEFVLRLEVERSKNYNVMGVDGGDGGGDEDAVFESVA